jgi:hypothetical protein
MVPPSAMNWMCRDFSLQRVSPGGRNATKGQLLPSRHVAILLGGLYIAIQIARLIRLRASSRCQLGGFLVGRIDLVVCLFLHL